MRKLRQTTLFRRASYWLLGLALFTIAVYAVQRTLLLRRQQLRTDERRARQELATLVDLWEGLVSDRIGSWLSDLAEVDDIDGRERQLRQTVPWFNAYYLWRQGDPPELLYPTEPPEEDVEALLASDCMREAHGLAVIGARLKAAGAFRACARTVGPEERMLASSMAASMLLSSGRSQPAWEALQEVDPNLQFPVQQAAERGLNVKRLVTRRLQGADALEGMGDLAGKRALELNTVREITALSGPSLKAMLPTAERLLKPYLGESAPDAAVLELRVERARRRLAGFDEVSTRLIRQPVGPRDAAGAEEDNRTAPELGIVQDSYNKQGFLLVYAPLADGSRIAAVQVELDELLTALLEATPRDAANPQLVIVDLAGNVVRGDPLVGKEGGPRLWVQVPFRHMIPQFQLGLVKSDEQTRSQRVRWLLSQLAPIGIALLLGVIAVVGRFTADRQQAELYERQQAFIARITHELKTPLAGIRVMAETLDLVGLNEKSVEFPRRIVREVERLDQRITEVLALARRPEVSARTPVAPDKLAADVVQQWRPRFERAGARIETDLRPCAPIAADPALLRDALNNLLDNALKYLREGRPGQVVVRTGEARRWVIFEVTDNGIGVPPAMRKKIFERFARVEGAGRGKSGGYGLGLSFVAEAASAHGGLVECLEGIDGGSRFRLKLKRR